MTGLNPLSIYLHWPFCQAKCPYCDFNSHVRPQIDESRWVAAFLRTLSYWREQADGYRVETVFWGGGTPSLLSPQSVGSILEHIAHLWPMANDCEITLEANPTTHETSRFEGLRAAGVNRLSLGVQSFRQPSLEFLGRQYDVSEASEALEHIARTFPRFSFDLIYALPFHTLPDWLEELEVALGFAGEHLSLYQLTFEPGTRFYQALQTGRMQPLDDETAADLFDATVERLAKAGLHQYEISNFSRPGAESRHNLVYWQGGEWIGTGPGAHGRLGRQNRRRAIANIRSPERWLREAEGENLGVESDTVLETNAAAEELVLTGLRLDTGVEFDHLTRSSGLAFDSVIPQARRQTLISEGLAWEKPGAFGLTAAGRLLLDSAIAYLLSPSEQ